MPHSVCIMPALQILFLLPANIRPPDHTLSTYWRKWLHSWHGRQKKSVGTFILVTGGQKSLEWEVNLNFSNQSRIEQSAIREVQQNPDGIQIMISLMNRFRFLATNSACVQTTTNENASSWFSTSQSCFCEKYPEMGGAPITH